MAEELPKRLFKEGEETAVTQINNNCRIDYIIKKIEEWLPRELAVVKKDPVFYQIFKLHENGLRYSARVIHSIICRELVTYKHYELWFVFARRPLRFSLLEFHAVTGFECNTWISLEEFDEWEDDDGFWSRVLRRKDTTMTLFNLWNKHKQAVMKWKNADRIRLIYLSIILCIVLARDEKANIPLKYITVVMDIEKVRKYPWGVAGYDLLCKSIAKNRDKLKEKTTSYVLDGFSYALQIWAMEAIPKLGKLCGRKLDKDFKEGPRCINWMGAAKVSYEEINRLESIFTAKDVIYPYISWRGNMDIVESCHFFRQDVNDDRITVLKTLIRSKHDFTGDAGAAESDEDFHTPKNLGATSRKSKKRLPDRGMEKRKQKVLSSVPQQAVLNEDMKIFMKDLFDQNFKAMEERLQKQMADTFEKMQSELKASRKDGSVEADDVDATQEKASTSQPELRRSKRGVKKH